MLRPDRDIYKIHTPEHTIEKKKKNPPCHVVRKFRIWCWAESLYWRGQVPSGCSVHETGWPSYFNLAPKALEDPWRVSGPQPCWKAEEAGV